MNRAIGFYHGDLIADFDLSREDAADRETADVVVVVEIGDEQLERVGAKFPRRRNRFHNLIEERLQVGGVVLELVFRRPSREMA